MKTNKPLMAKTSTPNACNIGTNRKAQMEGINNNIATKIFLKFMMNLFGTIYYYFL